MSYLLDTNVLSELVKPVPAASVVAWTGGQSPLDLSISVLTLGEIESRIALMPHGARRTLLTNWARTELPRQFLGRLLPVDEEVGLAWGKLTAAGRAAGRRIPVIDGLLLATALTYRLILVTRNVSDCADRGITVFDPWTGMLYK